MPNIHKQQLLTNLQQRFGKIGKLSGSESLFSIGNDAARLYVRYSKVHDRGRTFLGLRRIDLQQLEGHNSFLCFLLDDGSEPMFVPFADFEEVFRSAEAANDGQYKVQLFAQQNAVELYVARSGRFNVDGYVGFEVLQHNLDANRLTKTIDLTHSQVQTLVAGIGQLKGYDVWVPQNDVGSLDWSLTDEYRLLRTLPVEYAEIEPILSEIDVVWVKSGSSAVDSLFEVEHSTPVYSGLLRFNDVLLTDRKVGRFTIVSNDTRRALFSRQLFRPTFRKSGLADLASFMEYGNVLEWHARLRKDGKNAKN